ncbi:MAG: hypothetical protein PHR14_00120 [Oscillospiraceae bacterium]|nr:hypothetical protein [Oscillospiraceae bacterium]
MLAEKDRKNYFLQVKDLFSENRTAAEIFAELILTEHRNITKPDWTERQSQAIMKLSTTGDGENHLES